MKPKTHKKELRKKRIKNLQKQFDFLQNQFAKQGNHPWQFFREWYKDSEVNKIHTEFIFLEKTGKGFYYVPKYIKRSFTKSFRAACKDVLYHVINNGKELEFPLNEEYAIKTW